MQANDLTWDGGTGFEVTVRLAAEVPLWVEGHVVAGNDEVRVARHARMRGYRACSSRCSRARLIHSYQQRGTSAPAASQTDFGLYIPER